ncbi:ferredoxin [Rhodococcoides trifolii]|uniref:Ferredoxin n=1 Tax=Rhodococcoides trifolii TaxID=908250 RepID=A0A917G2U5_9NOCA|nr:ferredoxin [Rhodococcus trifolii]GGG19580.1 ferredoxin [Rhodococcus trifolii]
MKVAVDWERCEGHGLCAEQAPDVFSLDDEGELIYPLENAEIPDDQVASARSAVGSCPVAALRETL